MITLLQSQVDNGTNVLMIDTPEQPILIDLTTESAENLLVVNNFRALFNSSYYGSLEMDISDYSVSYVGPEETTTEQTNLVYSSLTKANKTKVDKFIEYINTKLS